MNTSSTIAPTYISITLTEGAAKHIQNLHQGIEAPGTFLRLWVQAGKCNAFEYGMGFDQPQEHDIKMESNGIQFVIDRDSLEHLQGSVIHFDGTASDGGFEIKNPNAKHSCHCGKSFE
jgi:iron-sulfur cluster assembly accessory protein